MATVASLFQINRLPAAWLPLAVTVAMISSRLPILLTRARHGGAINTRNDLDIVSSAVGDVAPRPNSSPGASCNGAGTSSTGSGCRRELRRMPEADPVSREHPSN